MTPTTLLRPLVLRFEGQIIDGWCHLRLDVTPVGPADHPMLIAMLGEHFVVLEPTSGWAPGTPLRFVCSSTLIESRPQVWLETSHTTMQLPAPILESILLSPSAGPLAAAAAGVR